MTWETRSDENVELRAKVDNAETMAKYAVGSIDAVTNRLRELANRLDRNELATERIKQFVDNSITTAVHELIEFLRSNDIQALNEDEFSIRVRELIMGPEQEYLPF